MKEYRLVERQYKNFSSWAIEEKIKVFWGSKWVEIEDDNHILDYDDALRRLKEYREYTPPKRIILDV